MSEPDVERTLKLLQGREVQERILKRMQDARSKATVTISHAASLFDFSESQLREWERRGLLKTDRPTLSSESKTSTGYRQYAPDELDKLALIRELMDQNYGLHKIPQNIDDIWKQVLSEQQSQVAATQAQDGRRAHEVKHVPLERHLKTIDQEELGLVDISFKEFLSEDDFINDVEALLAGIHTQDLTGQAAEEVVSFISIDIDNQSILAMKYGNRVARNLSSAVGARILGQLRMLSDPELRRLYHLNADSYCLLLKGVSLEDARNRAEQLRQVLGGDYRIDARGLVMGRSIPREGLLELQNMTVRLGVQCFPYEKLKELLQQYTPAFAVADVRALITQGIEESLEIGQREGGNCIMSWDREKGGYRRWSPSDAG